MQLRERKQVSMAKTLADRKLEAEIAKLEAEIGNLALERVKSEREIAFSERHTADELSTNDRHHVYNFTGSVSASSVEACIAKITRWARRDPGCDMTIIFNSPGGSVIDGLALYDCIAELKGKGHKFTTVARGYAASMGGILLQAGDKRVIGANAHLLVHEVSSGAIGKISEIDDHQQFTKMLADRLLAILAERSTLSAKQIANRWSRRDWWLGSEECVHLGLADEIG